MNYDPNTHPAFRDYLEAVEQTLRSSKVPASNREEIRENLITQFEVASADDASFHEEAFVNSLDDPHHFGGHWESEESPTAPGPVETASNLRRFRLPIALSICALLAILILGVVAYMIHLRNEVIVAKTAIKASWAQVETTLQRRYDLIPNIVETVRGFATQERTVLEEVVRLRSQWGEAKTTPEQQKAATALEGSLIKVVALSEQYPNLASNEQFLQLQYQLEGTENRIAVARTRYNDVLRYYNSLTQQFPASLFGFSLDENFFEAETAAGKAPQVKF